MNRLLIIISLPILATLTSGCSTKAQNAEFQLPQGAFAIVYDAWIYIEGEVDSVKGNFVFDTGAAILKN